MPRFSRDKILIVFALEEEALDIFHDGPLVFTGVGKVNAAYHLTKALYDFGKKNGQAPDLILNLGSAGSSLLKIGDVVACTHFIQRDMDTTAFGLTPFTTISDKVPTILDNGLPLDGIKNTVCGSGDNFVTDHADHPWEIVDMEAYALAKVALFEKLPFACVKYISDGGNDDAAKTWETGVYNSAHALRHVLDRTLLAA